MREQVISILAYNFKEHVAPYDAKINVACLLLQSEMNYGNIRLRMTLK